MGWNRQEDRGDYPQCGELPQLIMLAPAGLPRVLDVSPLGSGSGSQTLLYIGITWNHFNKYCPLAPDSRESDYI